VGAYILPLGHQPGRLVHRRDKLKAGGYRISAVRDGDEAFLRGLAQCVEDRLIEHLDESSSR
jgi:hypothetical protein